jgi:hypothetical protein
VVLVGVWGLLLLIATLVLIFRVWRIHYHERADYGAKQVAPAIDPLAQVVPPGVNREAWCQAVHDTHRALVGVTATNLLGLKEMHSLRDDVIRRVTRARPETALDDLSRFWDDLAARAAPALDPTRHPRPKLLKPRADRAAAGKAERTPDRPAPRP